MQSSCISFFSSEVLLRMFLLISSTKIWTLNYQKKSFFEENLIFFLAHFWYQSKQCTAMATPQATSSLLIILPCHDLQFLMIALIAIAMGGHLCCIYSANEIGKNWHNNLNRTQYNILLPLQFWGIKSRCFSQS